jgi:hypothetical protein
MVASVSINDRRGPEAVVDPIKVRLDELGGLDWTRDTWQSSAMHGA